MNTLHILRMSFNWNLFQWYCKCSYHAKLSKNNYKLFKSFSFSGDTLFLGGCGRFFEGTADQMYKALTILSSLPDHTKVFCGHEYTLQNLKFAAHVEPTNENVKAKISWSQDRRNQGKPTVWNTIIHHILFKVVENVHRLATK